jgi:hypothetical protein
MYGLLLNLAGTSRLLLVSFPICVLFSFSFLLLTYVLGSFWFRFRFRFHFFLFLFRFHIFFLRKFLFNSFLSSLERRDTLALNVISKRRMKREDDRMHYNYYLGDGVYPYYYIYQLFLLNSIRTKPIIICTLAYNFIIINI